MGKHRFDLVEATRLYVDEGWSCSHIGEYLGVTRQTIWKALKKSGVDTVKGGKAFWFRVQCAVCEKILVRNRARFRRQYHHYCSRDCYYSMLQSGATSDPGYHGGNLGHMARWKARKFYGGELPEGAVVHHENRDRVDNNADNLIIFRSQGDHMRWHRGISVEPLWPNPIPEVHLGYANARTFKSIKEIPKIKREGRFRDDCSDCGEEFSFTLYMLQKMGGFKCPRCGKFVVEEF